MGGKESERRGYDMDDDINLPFDPDKPLPGNKKDKVTYLVAEPQMTLQKQPRLELPDYIKWIRTLDCVICDQPGHDNNQIVPHHLIGIGGISMGMGTKAGDEWAMPMHVTCHNYFHASGELAGEQWEWVARTLARAVQEGVLK